jgi:hypothetical protein
LKIALKVIQDLFNLERHGLSWPQHATFMEPAVYDQFLATVSEKLLGKVRW